MPTIENCRYAIGASPKKTHCFECAEHSLFLVDRAQGPVEVAAFEHDRQGRVAFEAIEHWDRMSSPIRVVSNAIDNDGLPALAYVVADGFLYFQFATRIESKANTINHLGDDPSLLSDSGDGDETHAGCVTDLQEDAFPIIAFGGNLSCQLVFHAGKYDRQDRR